MASDHSAVAGPGGYAPALAPNHARSELGGDFDGGLRAYPAEGGADVLLESRFDSAVASGQREGRMVTRRPAGE